MALSRAMRVSAIAPVLIVVGYAILTPTRSEAIPAFARKYNVKCFNCHTIPPALNKTGYMFKRLGYRLPPDDMDGKKAWPAISELEPEATFRLTNSAALITQGSFTAEKNTGATPQSTSSFNLDEAALFLAGTVPQTNFSYFAQFELYQNGNTSLEQANFIYTGGRTNSSFFAKAGEMHMQEGEGTRAAMFYNLFPEPSLVLTNVDPLNFTLDQHPVGIAAGYTWASPYFKRIFGISAKVTNGLNADGGEILQGSSKNSKDVWLDADYWFGADAGVTFMTYWGTKDQLQNAGAPDQFTFRPVVRRYGVFGNYLFFDKLDILGGYMRSNDDWLSEADSPMTHYVANGYRGEVDYYIKTGWAVMSRYDLLNQSIGGGPVVHTRAWGVGSEKTLTSLGNIVLRGTYNFERDVDPLSGEPITDKKFMVDLRLVW